MDIAPTLLNKPEYFTCDQFHCRLRIDVCLGRIKANKQPRRPLDPIPFPDCEDCVQGKKNIQQAMDQVGRRGKPQRGQGYRYLSCPFYADCLEIVAKKNWKTFHCNRCDQYPGNKTVSEKIKDTRICETEGCENKTITPKHQFCASCLAKRSNAARAAKKKGPTKPNSITNSRGSITPKKYSLAPLAKLEINFDQYKTLFDQIKDLATEQIRTPEQQILYLLKTHPNLV